MYFNRSMPGRVLQHLLSAITNPSPPTMDGPWKSEDWTPSISECAIWIHPNKQAISDAIGNVKINTADIKEHPYHPEPWLHRAQALLVLGYPELATGDAWKTKTLCEAYADPKKEWHGEVRGSTGLGDVNRPDFKRILNMNTAISDLQREAYYTLIMALRLCNSFAEGIFYCNMAHSKYSDDPRFLFERRGMALQNSSPHNQGGHFVATLYPWTPENHGRRGNKTLSAASQYLQGLSDDQCAIRESTLVRGQLESRNDETNARKVRFIDRPSDIYGVIALKDIPAGTKLLTDVTVTSAANFDLDNNCENCHGRLDIAKPRYHSHIGCDARFCSKVCLQLALTSFHGQTCKGKLNWVKERGRYYRTSPPTNPLLLRFLATSVHEKTHPLDNETAAVLRGRYDGTINSPFSLEENIINVFRMLGDLGVNIFTNLHYDTWVVLTLEHKIRMSMRTKESRDGGFLLAINPCVNFINHSCTPNAAWSSMDGGSTVEVRTTRRIFKDEEIFISYHPTDAGGGTAQKQADLLRKFGCLCKCSTCQLREFGVE